MTHKLHPHSLLPNKTQAEDEATAHTHSTSPRQVTTGSSLHNLHARPIYCLKSCLERLRLTENVPKCSPLHLGFQRATDTKGNTLKYDNETQWIRQMFRSYPTGTCHPSRSVGGDVCARASNAAILLGDFLGLMLKQMLRNSAAGIPCNGMYGFFFFFSFLSCFLFNYTILTTCSPVISWDRNSERLLTTSRCRLWWPTAQPWAQVHSPRIPALWPRVSCQPRHL